MAGWAITGDTLSHPGCVHDLNEDAIAVLIGGGVTPDQSADLIAVVADGMGGHQAGEMASAIATRTVLHMLANATAPIPTALAEAMTEANRAIRARQVADPACAGMGTTCTILLLRDGAWFLAHIGDSRAYLCRSGACRQLTEDHSAIQELVRNGQLSVAEARNSPLRNIILRALGLKDDIAPLIWDSSLPAKENDVVVLCSDGLTDHVSEAVIAETVTQMPPHDACRTLMKLALQGGGRDNISVGVFHLHAPADDITRKILPLGPAR